MKPQLADLTEAEVISGIEDFLYRDGPYLKAQHCRLARKHGLNEARFAWLWDNAAEQAHQDYSAMQSRLSGVGKRFEALRPQTKPSAKVLSYRRNVGSSLLPGAQPPAENPPKNTNARKAIIAKFARANPDLAGAKSKPGEPEEPKQEKATEEKPAEIVFHNWSGETKKTASKIESWPNAPEPPTEATDLERLTYPRGLTGHVVQYIYDTAQLPDRFMALVGALSALSKCLDRKVLGPRGNSTILYIFLIAETGSGKQHIISCIRIILRAAGMEEALVASGIASVQAIEQILEGYGEKIPPQPSPLVVIDEYGSFLSRISSKGMTGNVSEIPSTLQTLWGWPSELEWTGSMKVMKERVTVLGPAFAIFGTSTERAFFTALKSKHVAGGFVNRHVLINAGRGAAKRVNPAYHWTQCPDWLVQALREVSGDPAPLRGMPLEIRADGKSTMLRDFRRIGWGPGAEEGWQEFEDEIRAIPSVDDRELWIRAPEIALRLATIVAVFRGSSVVEVEDIEWAIPLARYSTRQLAKGLSKHMLEEYEQADLVELIREEFRRKRTLTQGQIRKFCERKTDDHRKIGHALDHLVSCGDIKEVGETSGPGRPTRRWEWIG